MTVQNELSSMTPQQRANQAMLLLAGAPYGGLNAKSASNKMFGLSNVYSIFTGALNSWLSNNVKAVDISISMLEALAERVEARAQS